MGKGDTYRPVNKERYDKNYLRAYGKICSQCKGKGGWTINNGQLKTVCKLCNGIGYIERKPNDTRKV